MCNESLALDKFIDGKNWNYLHTHTENLIKKIDVQLHYIQFTNALMFHYHQFVVLFFIIERLFLSPVDATVVCIQDEYVRWRRRKKDVNVFFSS